MVTDRWLNELTARLRQRLLIFKGFHLASHIYEHPWLRPFGDVDVMVEDMRPLRALATQQHWRERRDDWHTTRFTLPDGVFIDAHEQPLPLGSLTTRRAFEHATPTSEWRYFPSFEDAALLAVGHLVKDRFAQSTLERAKLDLAALWSSGMDGEKLARRAKSVHMRRTLLVGSVALGPTAWPFPPASRLELRAAATVVEALRAREHRQPDPLAFSLIRACDDRHFGAFPRILWGGMSRAAFLSLRPWI